MMIKSAIIKQAKMRMTIVLMAACLLFSLASFAQISKIDSLFKAAASNGFSGVMLVAEKGKVKFLQAKGYRHFETDVPLQSDDIFELASLSKQFTAMVMMQLQEQGLLSFDDQVEKYLDIPYKNITIRHLLNHTSGLPDYQAIMDEHWDKTKVAGNDDAIAYLIQYAPPALFVPGEKYAYSNTGYLLLASIAEKAAGKEFIDMTRRNIFHRLKMKSTDIRSLEQKAATSNFAAGHLKDSTGKYVNANRFHASDYTVWLGNRKGPGRVSSNAKDLLKWDKALYTNKLIKQATLEQAFTPATLNDGSFSNYGFGWVLQPKTGLGKIVSHTGDNPGYSTRIVRMIDKKITIIMLCNNAHEMVSTLLQQTMEALQIP